LTYFKKKYSALLFEKILIGLYQSWALALFFQVRSPLNFYPWITIAHFANFQVRSSLNRSKKTSGSLLENSAKTLNRS